MMKIVKKRMVYGVATFCLLFIEVLIALFVHDKFIRPYIGDVIVVVLIYCIVRIIVPEKVVLLPLYVFLFACFTEIMQYINIVKILGLQDNRVLSIIIGSVFDWSDILSYGVGCVFLGIYEVVRYKKLTNNVEKISE